MKTLKQIISTGASLGVAAGIVLSSVGCASWPKPVKVIATPVALARDIVDIPLATYATIGLKYDGAKNPNRKTRPEQMNDSDCAGMFGFTAIIVSGVDYVACRSFCGSAKGKHPCKSAYRHETFWDYLKGDVGIETEDYRNADSPDIESWAEFLFPNIKELWFRKKNPY